MSLVQSRHRAPPPSTICRNTGSAAAKARLGSREARLICPAAFVNFCQSIPQGIEHGVCHLCDCTGLRRMRRQNRFPLGGVFFIGSLMDREVAKCGLVLNAVVL